MMHVNPFTYGNPISDAQRFTGRAREVEQIFSRLRNVEFESSSLVGERRIGKTSLLNYIADPNVRRAHGLDPQESIFVYADLALLDATTTPPRLWQYLLRQIVPHLEPDQAQILNGALHDASSLDNFTLAEIFDRLDAQKRRVVLLLDEFENVTRNHSFGPDFFYGLRSLAIHHHLALITSSRRELIELTHSDEIRSSPFFNIFANINVRLLTRPDAIMLISNALQNKEFRFTEAEIETLIRLAGTHPFFLQSAAHFLFQEYIENLDAPARSTAWQEKFRAEAMPHLFEYWRQCEPREKVVLAACALRVPHEQAGTTAAMSDITLRNFLARSERILAQLEKRALISQIGEQYMPFNQLFTQYILAAFEDAHVADGDGQNITLHQALLEAVKPSNSDSNALPAGLTPREVQVLRLVATGLSDVQVATKLVVSPRTVSTHLQSIYNKIGVNSRAAATRFAHENNLV
jgi:DNA-binding CsgD family transcriptional regulator